MKRRVAFALALLAALALPASLAHACSVCGGNTPEPQRIAFIVTTALMTFLPLSLLFGGFFYLRKRVREVEARERAELERGGSQASSFGRS